MANAHNRDPLKPLGIEAIDVVQEDMTQESAIGRPCKQGERGRTDEQARRYSRHCHARAVGKQYKEKRRRRSDHRLLGVNRQDKE